MAAGYAAARPPVHPRIIERVREYLRLAEPAGCALDVGCGAGISTRPLEAVARVRIGIEPAERMLQWTATVAPGAHFVVGTAEFLPVRSGSVDLITAAGSLNYADLDRFLPEAVRVLRPGGVLVVYDFSRGRTFRAGGALDEWYGEFMRRYWPAPGSARELNPAILAGVCRGFRLDHHEHFEIPLPLSPEFYLEYVLTETNVAEAVAHGGSETEIRAWCDSTLRPVFSGRTHDVLFRGYVAYLRPEE